MANTHPQNYAPELGLTAPLVLAAVIEEVFKFSFVRKAREEEYPASKGNFFLKILLIGLGFSLTELFLNISRLSPSELPYGYALGAILLHLATVFIMGYLFLKTTRGETTLAFLIALPAIILHLSYNLLVIHIF